MLLLAKAALGMGGALVLAGAYTFREGVIRIDVDEQHPGSDHVHLWLPAAVVPMAMHFVPKNHLCEAAGHAREFLPLTHVLIKELKRFPDATFVEITGSNDHVLIRTQGGKLQIDVNEPGENAHLLVPLSTLEDVAKQLEVNAPGA
jgi:hypothetical protein